MNRQAFIARDSAQVAHTTVKMVPHHFCPKHPIGGHTLSDDSGNIVTIAGGPPEFFPEGLHIGMEVFFWLPSKTGIFQCFTQQCASAPRRRTDQIAGMRPHFLSWICRFSLPQKLVRRNEIALLCQMLELVLEFGTDALKHRAAHL